MNHPTLFDTGATPKPRPPVVVLAASLSPSVCHTCRKPVTWARTAETNKPLLFESDPETQRLYRDGRGRLVAELDPGDVHFSRCGKPDRDRMARDVVTR